MSIEKPKGADEFDEHYWREFRARSRKRAAMQMLLVIGPLGIAVVILRILDPTTYPAGDIGNSLDFRLLSNGAGIVFFLILIALSVRWLRAGRRQHE
jgi:hypothetical protein